LVLVAENLHIISKTTKEAIVQKNDAYLLNIVKKCVENSYNVFDLNIGPAKDSVLGAFEYLTGLICRNFDVNFSFDSSNFDEIKKGFESIDVIKAENSFLNSVCADETKLKKGFEIAKEFNSNAVALAFDPARGISKTSDERLELAFSIYEGAAEFEINPEKLYFDPLVLPVSVAQEQAGVVLDAIRMLKEGLDSIHTIIGLSNISNGSPKEARPLLNRVFLVLAIGAGLDSAIVDGFDVEITRIYEMIENMAPKSSKDELYISLYKAVSEFLDIDDIKYNKDNIEEVNIIKAARVLLNKEIYSHSFSNQ